MRKPLLVYVSGTSGSGKTTLAAKIAQKLYLQHITSDLVIAGVRATERGDVTDRELAIKNVFVPLLNTLVKSNVSLVVDGVLYKNKSEHDIIEKIKDNAFIVNIHVNSPDYQERFYQREMTRTDIAPHRSSDELLNKIDQLKDKYENNSVPLLLDAPLKTVVAAGTEYEPNLDDIIEFIDTVYGFRVDS